MTRRICDKTTNHTEETVAIHRKAAHVHVGIAGWATPPVHRIDRQPGHSQLKYYAEHFSCVEINSSFYRPHRACTYTRWREETPAHFLFSVKMPRVISHDARLRHAASEVSRFYEAIEHLQPKLGVVLIQLPPSLEFSASIVRSFFKKMPRLTGTAITCEPRHVSWFTRAADDALRNASVSRVATDPARHLGSGSPAGAPELAYFRWHGSPQMYYSKYTHAQLTAFLTQLKICAAKSVWCTFDNTARYAAWDDAFNFAQLLGKAKLT